MSLHFSVQKKNNNLLLHINIQQLMHGIMSFIITKNWNLSNSSQCEKCPQWKLVGEISRLNSQLTPLNIARQETCDYNHSKLNLTYDYNSQKWNLYRWKSKTKFAPFGNHLTSRSPERFISSLPNTLFILPSTHA